MRVGRVDGHQSGQRGLIEAARAPIKQTTQHDFVRVSEGTEERETHTHAEAKRPVESDAVSEQGRNLSGSE